MPKTNVGKLTEAQKAFVVRRLACFDTPKEAADALRLEHGITLAPQSVERYDPTKRAGATLAKHLATLFHAARRDFLDNVDAIPEANRAVRIQHLASSARALKVRGNHAGMAALLKQIAEEVGNVYTNRREHTGKNGGPIHARLDLEGLSDEELEARFRKIAPELAPILVDVMGGGDAGPGDDG